MSSTNMPRIYNFADYSEILKKIHLIMGEGLCSNIYLIGKEDTTIVDTGIGNYTNPIWPQFKEIGITPNSVKNVVLTHIHHDHAMGTYVILERANPNIFIHKIDALHIGPNFGQNLIMVEDEDLIDTEIGLLRVIWTPGHTRGSICLYHEMKKILFSGDTVFPNGNFGRYDGDTGSIHDIIESLEKLTGLDIDIMLPGHGMPVLENASDHIKLSYMNAKSYG
jgi:glyoxylase-like metal-dependent hydrolase (beta-lactamase superfamily II)